MEREPYSRYWGKARPAADGPRYHLLAYHSLDVAACADALIRLPAYSLGSVADSLGWRHEVLNQVFVYFMALHDIGKFSPTFQNLAQDLSPDLVPKRSVRAPLWHRHDTLGLVLWEQCLIAPESCIPLPEPDHDNWCLWAKAVFGHHGQPPRESEQGGMFAIVAGQHFLKDDIAAARTFARALADLLLPDDIPVPQSDQLIALKHHSWAFAGVAVLADWIGSNQSHFLYESTPRSLAEYWIEVAQPNAATAVKAAGLQQASVRRWEPPEQLLVGLPDLSPLQQHAATVVLEDGPQLFILEDVTGAGKTEAALLLAHRMMAAGLGHGLYFALPTMATANHMYRRVGAIYRRMFDPTSHPSLVLAHSAREMVDGFRESVVQDDASQAGPSTPVEGSDSSAECSAWLADHRKKALLAEVGVGTIDQALLAVMPVRHQSLRMLGLQHKVLIVDEVHAYDSYMLKLLKELLAHQASRGGNVILLSATIPLTIRAELVVAFQRGGGLAAADNHGDDRRYPLATRVGAAISTHACATRPQLQRTVHVTLMHDEAKAIRFLVERAVAGRCVGWIRNTVEDARRGWQALAAWLPAETVMLFHSRYALGDRLAIENRVGELFGVKSTAALRRGRVVVGTQVLEQSLDYDVDVMLTDLAPIDLVIQRAGRLMRHPRMPDGERSTDGHDHRGEPVLYVLGPPPVEVPAKDWYSEMFPKACYVYPDAGRLWLGARVLHAAKAIVTPGANADAGAVRTLIESVYGDTAMEIPEELVKATNEQMGRDLAMESQGGFNTLRRGTGYCIDSSARWDEDDRVPTRLGDETLPVYLAVVVDSSLAPLRNDLHRPWEASAVRVDARRFKGLGAEWLRRYGAAVEALRIDTPLLKEPALILPLVPDASGVLHGFVTNGRDEMEVRYDSVQGLVW